MPNFNNPFSIDRAEQLGEDLFKFFAHHKNLDDLLKKKSLMVQGGRGSGKTMFFLYHTYKSQKNESKSKKISFQDFISKMQVIGLHYRCDSNFVPAFQHKGLNTGEWSAIFAHYLNITISKQLIEIIIDINCSIDASNKIPYKLSNEIEILFNGSKTNDFESLLNLLIREEISTIKFINDIGRSEKPSLIVNGFLINVIAKNILNEDLFKQKVIHVFIDEYENLLEYQQIIINTLIKHPAPVFFDIGLRNAGIKTYCTLAEGELISYPNDYNHFKFEDFKKKDFEEFILEVCKKRFQTVEEYSGLRSNDKCLDIRFYLGEEDINAEVKRIFLNEKNKEAQYFNELLDIRARLIGKEEKDFILNIEDPLIKRLIITLIDRGNSIKEIIKEYKKHSEGDSEKFKDWLHNNSYGIVFLLTKELGKKKKYYGFNTFVSLSSGIVRYFIELCEGAFRNAGRNDFSFNNPRLLTNEEQTEAAMYISRYKIKDIDTCAPYGQELRQFVYLLGKIFERLHKNPKLSEPEQNHFATDYLRLSSFARRFLTFAEMYSILQKREETKDKSDSVDANNDEFHLNHIYAPYFQISPRRKRKIDINYNHFEMLISDDVEKAEKAANLIVGDKDRQIDNGQLTFQDLF